MGLEIAAGWRFLQPYEVIQTGDKCCSQAGYNNHKNPSKWTTCFSTIGQTVAEASQTTLKYFARHEEPVKADKEWLNPWD